MAVDPISTAHFLNIPNKEDIQKALELGDVDRAGKLTFESFKVIEDWARKCFEDGIFGRRTTIQHEIMWTHSGPLYTRDSPEFYVPENLDLVEVVYHLTTAASVTGPTIKVFKGATELDSEAMGTSDDATVSITPTAFTADTDELRFQINSVGDGTARTLVCYARFE
jgi:hypothetical protein